MRDKKILGWMVWTLCLFLACLACSSICRAQGDGYHTNSNLRGVVPFGSYQFGQIDDINLATGTVNLRIPLVSRKGRGLDDGLAFVYSSKIWIVRPFAAGPLPDIINARAWEPSSEMPYGYVARTTGGRLDMIDNGYICTLSDGRQFWVKIRSNFVYREPDGSIVQFLNRRVIKEWSAYFLSNCITPLGGPPPPPSDETQIHVGYSDSRTMVLDTSSEPYVVRYKDGRQVITAFDGFVQLPPQYKDRNGNTLNNLDTLGRTGFKDSSGQGLPFTTTSATIPITTAFPTTGTPEAPNCYYQYRGGLGVTTSLSLPNGQTFNFQYDPGFGELTRVDLPSGGYIKYVYQTFAQMDDGPAEWSPCVTALDSRRVVERRVSADGVNEQVWRYEYPNGNTTRVTDPLGNITIDTGEGSQIEIQDSTGTPKKRIVNGWIEDAGPAQLNQDGSIHFSNRKNKRLLYTTTTLLDVTPNLVSRTENDYDSFTYSLPWAPPYDRITDTRMNVAETREYGYGAGPPWPLLRRTRFTYLHDTDANYLDRHIWDRVTSRKVYDSLQDQCAGQQRPCAQTTFSYDTTPITATSGVVQHDYTNYSAGMPYRGNVTETKVWRNTDSAWLTTRNWYDDLGNMVRTQDPLNHTTSLSYSDSWANSTCAPVGGTAQAFVTQVTNHLGHSTRNSYYSCSSLVGSTTDPNTQTTTFTYDLFDRPLVETRPTGGGSTTWAWDDVNRKATRTVTIGNGVGPLTGEFSYDGLWRVTQSRLTSDPQGTVFADTTYDPLGRKSTVSNPYRATSDPTYGITTFEYDALGRVTEVIPPDGTATTNRVVTEYCGNATKVTDQAGKWRRSVTDALGRLIEVHEPNSLTASAGPCPQPGDPVAVTAYAYDALDNLTRVEQRGNTTDPTQWRTRTFVYNSLPQLTSAANPESGTINYSYDDDGNLITKTDARNITTTHTYDALHRLSIKTYSDATPSVVYYYDAQTSGAGGRPATGSVAIGGAEQSTRVCDTPDPPLPPRCFTIYDEGTVWIQVNAFRAQTTYGRNSTAASIAASLANVFNNDPASPVAAVVSGSTVNLTTRSFGSGANYALSSGSSTSDPINFPTPSFSATRSGPTLTGGSDGHTGCGLTLTITNGIGRRTGMCDAAGKESWSYDALGRVLTNSRTTNSVTKNTSYTYNLDGSVATVSYPSGRTVTYAYNAAARPLSAVDTPNTINYALSASYAPQGALASVVLGQSANFAGINLNHGYSSRLQPTTIRAWSTSGVALDLGYCFNVNMDLATNNCAAAPILNNGNVVEMKNNLTTARTQNYTYDELNRVKTARTQATSGQFAWGHSFGYDIWANLLSASVTQGSAPTLSVSVNSSNRISGFCYDAAGNLLAESAPPCPVPTYTYDAENRMKTAAGVTYTYDGDGKRVQKSTGKLYWYGMGSDPLAESDAAGNLSDEYIFFTGKRIARRDSAGSVFYYFADHLGTARIVTNAAGTILDDSDFYPFGGERPVLASSGNNYKFTGKERDPESGLDFFIARYYSPGYGRFLSPDEFTGGPVDAFSANDPLPPGPLPYADIGNPQSLNKYVYTHNNPLSFVDRDGHCTEPVSFVACVVVAAASVALLVRGLHNLSTESGKKLNESFEKSRSCSDSNAECTNEEIRSYDRERVRTYGAGAIEAIKDTVPSATPATSVKELAGDIVKDKVVDWAKEKATKEQQKEERRKSEEEKEKKRQELKCRDQTGSCTAPIQEPSQRN